MVFVDETWIKTDMAPPTLQRGLSCFWGNLSDRAVPVKVQFGRKDRFKCHTFQDLGSEPGPYLPSRFKTCVP